MNGTADPKMEDPRAATGEPREEVEEDASTSLEVTTESVHHPPPMAQNATNNRIDEIWETTNCWRHCYTSPCCQVEYNICEVFSCCKRKKLVRLPLALQYTELIRNTVFEFYSPPNGSLRNLDIVFFHGLQSGDYKQAFWKTWRTRDLSELWPKWISETLPSARILSISYFSHAFGHAEEVTPGDMSQFLAQKMIIEDTVAVGQDCPVIFVGHSLGGIFIKKFILHCNKESVQMRLGSDRNRMNRFLQNCKGTIFFSSPFLGSDVATFVEYVPMGLILRPLYSPLIKLLKETSKKRDKINDIFSNVRQNLQIKSYAFCENYATQAWCVRKRVVNIYSAAYDSDAKTLVQANHSDVCKMENKTAEEYKRFLKYIQNILHEDSAIQRIINEALNS